MNRSDSRLTGACRRVENDHPHSLYDYTVWAFVFFVLCVPQAAPDDPDICCHHRHNAKYNQVLHAVSSFVQGQ